MAGPSLLLLPRVTAEARTVTERVASAVALGALIESSVLLVVDGLPGGAEQLDVLRGMADGARAWRVDLGHDLLADPAGTAGRLLELG
jgi:hypothetical protein